MVIRLSLLVIFCFTLRSSSYGATSTWPYSIPLFQKSPYFNAWVEAGNLSTSPTNTWPRVLNQQILEWFIGIRVDNASYTVQGYSTSVNYTTGTTVSVYIMPTQTRFTIAAGPVLVNLTYLAPIELQDWTLHSFPFAYAALDIISSNGNSHAIQLYIDISAELISQDGSSILSWNTNFTTKSVYHMIQQRTLQPLAENNSISQDGSQFLAYTATPSVSMTWQSCHIEMSRSNFSSHGKLENTSDTDFRGIYTRLPGLAYALDLGNITNTSNTLVFGIGLIRDPVASYRTAKTTQSLSHLWYSRWNSIGLAIDDFLTSYSSASSRADAFDDHIQLNLHILNLRQTVGSLEFTTLKPKMPVDMKDVRVFMKDVGYSRRTDPVEILYASFPAFLFLNTTLAGKLLEPLLEFQASSLYNNDYAAPDLGSSWPTIQGNTTDQSLLAIDSCGAMLIMALAHAQKSGDGTLLFNYYNLLRKWADYLVRSAQQPGSYMSSDGSFGPNANLALKGIMGLYAMGRINKILEARGAYASNTSYYLDTANAYAQDWLKQAVSSDHVMASYGLNSTWAMIYNLFAPRLLGATIIPEQIYETQASWYASRNQSAANFGLPFDSTQSQAKAHWTLLSASSVFNATSSGGRDDLISMVHSRSFSHSQFGPNPASYNVNINDSSLPGGSASPAMGAIYSLLALYLPDFTSTITLPLGTVGNSRGTVDDSRSTAKVSEAVIIGVTLGSVGGLILLAAVVFFVIRRRRQSAHIGGHPIEELPQGPSNITPFTDDSRRLATNGFEVQNRIWLVQNGNRLESRIPRTLQTGKHLTIPSSNPIHQTAAATNTGVEGEGGLAVTRDGGGNAEDSNLRQEVEQLRRVVETLGAQQPVQQGGLPDEPPPMYASQ